MPHAPRVLLDGGRGSLRGVCVRHSARGRIAPVPVFRDEAIVLRTHKLGEADRIVTMLTRRHGRVRAVAKGVRRTSSRFGARLEPFALIDVQAHIGRSLDVVNQVETIAAYGAQLCDDYPRWTAGQAMLETAERMTPEDRAPAPQQFLLLVGGLKALVEGQHDAGLVLDAYLLRSLAIAGWAPSFAACARCGAEGPHRWFAVTSGGSLCERCKVAGAAVLSPLTLQLLGSLLAGDWEVADGSEARSRREASGIVAAQLQWHLERSLRSLPLVDRTTG